MKLNNIISAVILVAILSASVQLLEASDNPPDHSPERIRHLIQQLGAAKFADREDATKALIAIGYYARNDVQKSQGQSDPEVRMRLKRIWKEIGWHCFPGAEEDVKELLNNIKPMESNYEKWEALSKKYGAKLLLMILEVDNKLGHQKQRINGIKSLLSTTESASIASYIQNSPKKKKIISLFTSIKFDITEKSKVMKLLNIFYILDLKQEVLQMASSNWRNNHSTKIPAKIMNYFKDKTFVQKAFETLRQRIDKSDTTSQKDWQISFFAKIAKKLNRPDLTKKLLENIDYNITDERVILYLSKILISIKLYNEALHILLELHTPKSIYLRAVAYNNAGEKQKSEELMTLLNTKLTTEENCFAIADEMDKFKDIRAVTILQKILKMQPDNSVYDANARFRLAEFYNSKGKYAKAADLMEDGMKNMKGFFMMTINGRNYTGDEAKERSIAKIADLRSQEKGGAEIWYKALHAMKKGENEKALQLFDEFIKNNPEYHKAYYLKSEIFLRCEESERAVKELTKAINCTVAGGTHFSQKNTYILEKSKILRESNNYDDTIETLNEAVKLNPKNEEILMMLAMTQFYAGYYKQAGELYSKCSELNPKDLYAPLWEFIALKKIKKSPEKEFAKFADTINGDKWPTPLIRYYAGSITLEQCLKSANSADKIRENEKKCETYYFIGAYLQGLGDNKKATEMFKKCIKCNIQNFREHNAAIIELAK